MEEIECAGRTGDTARGPGKAMADALSNALKEARYVLRDHKAEERAAWRIRNRHRYAIMGEIIESAIAGLPKPQEPMRRHVRVPAGDRVADALRIRSDKRMADEQARAIARERSPRLRTNKRPEDPISRISKKSVVAFKNIVYI